MTNYEHSFPTAEHLHAWNIVFKVTAPTLIHSSGGTCMLVSALKPGFFHFLSQWFTNSSLLKPKQTILSWCTLFLVKEKKKILYSYLAALLSSTAGFSLSCNPIDVYPSQNVLSTLLYQNIDKEATAVSLKHKLPCRLVTSCLYLPINPLEYLLCHCSNRFPRNQSDQVWERLVGRGGGRRRPIRCPFKPFP